MATKIEWAEETINPVRTVDGGYHCTKISPGCSMCYAERFNKRFGNGKPFDAAPTEFVLWKKPLQDVLRWRKPRLVFVQSMGDLFHPDVPYELLRYVFDIMRQSHTGNYCRDHTYMVLTKRPERMREFIERLRGDRGPDFNRWPMPWVWLGVTGENQEQADKRIPILLQIPTAVRFVSVEPMLGPIILSSQYYDYLQGWNVYPEHDPSCDGSCSAGRCPVPVQYETEKLDWVICGTESGPGRRPADIDWIRSLRGQCVAAAVPFFLKQMEIGGQVVKMPELDGRTWAEMPEVSR